MKQYVVQYRKTKGAKWTDWEAFTHQAAAVGIGQLDRQERNWQAFRVMEREETEVYLEERPGPLREG